MNDSSVLAAYSEKKICEVCGDLALSYNFNALTCESCKAFFRRNAHKEKLKCAFKSDCPINRVTRKFCQCCRLRKCYGVGMKRELILSEDQKVIKRRKIQANRDKASKLSDGKQREARSETRRKESGVLGVLDQFEPPYNPLHPSGGIYSDNSTQTQRNLVDSSVQTDVYECTCLSSLNNTTAQPGISLLDGKGKKLGVDQKKLLDDLVMANDALEAPLEAEASSFASDAFQVWRGENGGNLLDVINLTAVAIRRLIKMCKRISGFRGLCTPDQVSLLKHGCTPMMLLRSVLNFDPDRNSWKIPHTVNQLSRIKVEVLKEAQGNLYEAHEHFLTTFDSRASHDKYLICILTALELFDPTRPNLLHPNSVQQQQDCYYDLLKQYLGSEFGPVEAVSIYKHLLGKMEELHRLCEDHIRVYLNVNPSQVEPLLIEIFDLKPH